MFLLDVFMKFLINKFMTFEHSPVHFDTFSSCSTTKCNTCLYMMIIFTIVYKVIKQNDKKNVVFFYSFRAKYSKSKERKTRGNYYNSTYFFFFFFFLFF